MVAKPLRHLKLLWLAAHISQITLQIIAGRRNIKLIDKDGLVSFWLKNSPTEVLTMQWKKKM